MNNLGKLSKAIDELKDLSTTLAMVESFKNTELNCWTFDIPETKNHSYSMSTGNLRERNCSLNGEVKRMLITSLKKRAAEVESSIRELME